MVLHFNQVYIQMADNLTLGEGVTLGWTSTPSRKGGGVEILLVTSC